MSSSSSSAGSKKPSANAGSSGSSSSSSASSATASAKGDSTDLASGLQELGEEAMAAASRGQEENLASVLAAAKKALASLRGLTQESLVNEGDATNIVLDWAKRIAKLNTNGSTVKTILAELKLWESENILNKADAGQMRKLFMAPLKSPAHRKKRKRTDMDEAIKAAARSVMPPPQPSNASEDEGSGTADGAFETEHERRQKRKANKPTQARPTQKSYRKNTTGSNKGKFDARCGNIGCKKRRQYSYAEKKRALEIWDRFRNDPTIPNSREMAKKEAKIQAADLLSKWQKQREHIFKMAELPDGKGVKLKRPPRSQQRMAISGSYEKRGVKNEKEKGAGEGGGGAKEKGAKKRKVAAPETVSI